MKYYYIIVEQHIAPSKPHDSKWPKIISYNFAYGQFLILEGAGHGLMGGEIKKDCASFIKWRGTFVDLNAEWFLDFLNRNLFSDENDFLSKLVAIMGQPRVMTY